MIKMGCKSTLREMLPRAYFSDEYSQAAALFMALAVQRWGQQDVVLQRTLKYFAFLENTLFTKERMLQDFDFPIAFCNGTRDFFGNAEGADTIVKNNRFYKSG